MSPKFPADAPKSRVIAALEALGFRLTLPNHPSIKGSTLRTICTQARIPREEFLTAYFKLH
jgi:hypothetical protein